MAVMGRGLCTWIKKGPAGAGEVAQQVKVLTNFAEDLSLVLIQLALTPAAGGPMFSLASAVIALRHAHTHTLSLSHTQS